MKSTMGSFYFEGKDDSSVKLPPPSSVEIKNTLSFVVMHGDDFTCYRVCILDLHFM